MQTPGSPTLNLFNDGIDSTSDEVLALDASRLLDSLNHLESSDTAPTMRRGILELIRRIQDPQDKLRSVDNSSNDVEFTRGFLLSQLQQIATSETLERALHYLKRFKKSITEVRVNEINDINLNRWKEYKDIYLDSLWVIDKRENSGVHTAGYWGNFIPQIPHQMMKRYTKKGDWVLDTFAGGGTTLIEGQRLGRNTIGIELQEQVAARARSLISLEPNIHGVRTEVLTGDSSTVDFKLLLNQFSRESVQMVIMHPPYHDIIKFSEDERDLSNAPSLDAFLQMMAKIVGNASEVLDSGRYLALVIGDKYSKGEWIPLGFLTMNEVIRKGFSLKSIVVKNFEDTTGKRQQKQLWNYRALAGGFYIFKHEYIFVFRKQ